MHVLDEVLAREPDHAEAKQLRARFVEQSRARARTGKAAPAAPVEEAGESDATMDEAGQSAAPAESPMVDEKDATQGTLEVAAASSTAGEEGTETWSEAEEQATIVAAPTISAEEQATIVAALPSRPTRRQRGGRPRGGRARAVRLVRRGRGGGHRRRSSDNLPLLGGAGHDVGPGAGAAARGLPRGARGQRDRQLGRAGGGHPQSPGGRAPRRSLHP